MASTMLYEKCCNTVLQIGAPHRPLPMMLTHGFLLSFPFSAIDDGAHTYRQPPSDQSQVGWVTQLRTDGVHRLESAGSGPEVLKVAPVTGAAFSGNSMDKFLCAPLFPHPLYYTIIGTICSLSMYGHHTKQTGHQGMVANPACGQLKRDIEISCPRSRLWIYTIQRVSEAHELEVFDILSCNRQKRCGPSVPCT